MKEFERLKGIFKEEMGNKIKEAKCGPCKRYSCFMKTALEIIDAGVSIDIVSSLVASIFLAAKKATGSLITVAGFADDRLVEAMEMAKEDLERVLGDIKKKGPIAKRKLKDKLGSICDLFESTLYLAGKKEPKEPSEMPGAGAVATNVMDKEKKKEFIKSGAEFKVGILKGLIESGKRCVCEEGEHCSMNAALDFLKEHPEVPVEELATLITMFELSLLESQEYSEDFVHFSPLEEISEEDQEGKEKEEKGEGEISFSMEGLKQRHLKGKACCGDDNCTMNLALEILRMAGDQWEKVLVPLSKILEHYYSVGACILETVLEDLEELTQEKPTMPGDCSGD